MKNFNKLVSLLLLSSTQVHIFHLQTNSFSENSALNTYYDKIVELADGLIESYQGKYDILTNYENPSLQNYSDNAQVVAYFSRLAEIVKMLRQEIEDSYIQNQIDNVIELIESTKYKLRFLS